MFRNSTKNIALAATCAFIAMGCNASFAVPSKANSDNAINRGDDLLGDDRVKEAVEQFEGAVAAAPKSSQAHQRLGRALALLHRPDEAKDELNKAIHLNPLNTRAHTDLGWVYGMQGAYQSSISEERRAVELDANNTDAYLNLGVALAHENEYEAAARAFQAASTLEPDNVDVEVNLAAILARQGLYQDAIAHYRHVLAREKDNVTAHLGLGAALGKTGDLQGEVTELQTATALAPKSATAHGRLGYALYSKGDYSGAFFEGVMANQLRLKTASNNFAQTALLLVGGLVILTGIVFGALILGTRFNPRQDEKVLRSFFLVFYKELPGRFVITNRRLVFNPEALAQFFGATRLSFDHSDVEDYHGKSEFRGSKLNILCTNGSVYPFAMPAVVLEPLLEELRKIEFGAQEEKKLETASQLRLKQVKLERPEGFNPGLKEDQPAEGTIITVVDLPDKFKDRKDRRNS